MKPKKTTAEIHSHPHLVSLHLDRGAPNGMPEIVITKPAASSADFELEDAAKALANGLRRRGFQVKNRRFNDSGEEVRKYVL